MNLVQLVKYIEAIALEHPLVKSFYEGSVYEHLNSKEVKYGAFVLTQPDFNSVVKDDNVKRYTFQASYVDRLTEDESNKLVIQTDGINVIHEIFNYIKTNAQTADIEIPITFTTFTQKFADKCGGAFATVTVETNDETGDCDFYYEDILVEPIPGTSHTTVLDNYYTKVEVEDLIADLQENKADKVISLINVNNSPIDDTFILYNLTQMNVLGELGNGTNITFVLPTPIQDTVNESIVHFTTNALGVPTFTYNNFVPRFESEKTIEMNISKSYTICFEQLYDGQDWIVKTTWGEF